MRRKDREITDFNKIINIIDSCKSLRLGFNDNGEVYIVPLNFGYECKGEKITFYFHGAKEGRKIELIKKSPYVGFEMDTNAQIYANGDNSVACNYSTTFQSIIGTGNVSLVTAQDEKFHALTKLMRHLTHKNGLIFKEEMVNAVSVFKLEVTKLSCKEHE